MTILFFIKPSPAAGGGGTQTLSPSLVSDDDTLYAPTVTPGAVTLSPSLLSDGDTLYAPIVTQGTTLLPPLLDDGDTLYAPTVSVGSVTLSPPLLDDGDTLYTPTVTNGGATQTLLPPLLDDGDTLYAPTISVGSVTLSPPLINGGNTLYPPTVYDGEIPPAPAAPTTGGVPGGRRRAPRAAVRIDGELYVGTYAEISELVASLGERDAYAEAAPEPVSKRTARTRARKAAGRFDKLMQVIDIGLPEAIDLPIDPAPVAQRDLREEYLRAYAAAMLAAQRAFDEASARAAEEAARREQEIEADDLDAINRALELI
jgi:hypothetical protein